MTQLATGKETKYDSVSWEVKTPDGTMFVHVLEKEGRPVGIMINMGKAGSAISAWADCVGRLVTVAFERGAGVNEIISELSGLSAAKGTKLPSGVLIRSGPEGIAFALMQYKNHLFAEHKKKMEGSPVALVVDNGSRVED